MNSTLQDAITAGLAAVERVMDPPKAPYVYGSDMSCMQDLDQRMIELDGDDPTVVYQAIVRRLDCPKGALRDDGSYGEDIRGMLNKGATEAERQSIAGRARQQIMEDDRVDSVTVTVTLKSTGGLAISIAGRLADPDRTLFTLTLALVDSTLLLEAIA